VNTIETTVDLDITAAEAELRAALAEEGFGVLTEIDVAATLQAKLGVTRPPLRILGACNPGFADRALRVDRDAALMLPCNVVLESEGDRTRLSTADPRDLMPGDDLAELTAEVAARLTAALGRVGA
jgi:uncharacterized protein (DUF302 family)